MALKAEAALAISKKYTEDTVLGMGAIKGDKGESAYQIAVKHGFRGTEQEWLASLKGVGAVIYASSQTQTGNYNINTAVMDCITDSLKSPDAKEGALISVLQPFEDGDKLLYGSGYILNHGDNKLSGLLSFSVLGTTTPIPLPSPIEPSSVVAGCTFNYNIDEDILAVNELLTSDALTDYAVALQQKATDAGKGLVIGDDGKVKTGTIQAEVEKIEKINTTISDIGLSVDDDGVLWDSWEE